MPDTSGATPGSPGASGTQRSGLSAITLALFIAGLVVVLLVADVLVLAANDPARALNKHEYMALGNSLSFGFQPDLNFTSGFVDDIFADLHRANVTDVVNYACGGESTTSMINGNCPFKYLPHSSYTGPQLDAAITFLQRHPGQVSPITLEIGANDVLPDWNDATCTENGNVAADIALVDQNLTQTILPRLVNALKSPTGVMTGDLHLLNYYNPFAKQCPNSTAFVNSLNTHLAADAGQFRIPIVDIYNTFGGDLHTADHICDYTWICDQQFHDFHPNSVGYRVMAKAIEATLGLPPSNPIQNLLPSSAQVSPAKLWDAA